MSKDNRWRGIKKYTYLVVRDTYPHYLGRQYFLQRIEKHRYKILKIFEDSEDITPVVFAAWSNAYYKTEVNMLYIEDFKRYKIEFQTKNKTELFVNYPSQLL